MKLEELQSMKVGQKLFHKRYGECKLVSIMNSLFGGFMGVVIRPTTPEGKRQLFADSGTKIQDFLEGTLGRLKPSNTACSPTAPVARRKSRKSTSRKSSAVRGG